MSYSPSMSSIFPSQDTTRIRVLMSPARTRSSCVPDRVCYDVRAELGFAKGHASCLTFITFHDYVRTWTIPPHSTQPNFTMYVVTLTVSYFSRWMLNTFCDVIVIVVVQVRTTNIEQSFEAIEAEVLIQKSEPDIPRNWEFLKYTQVRSEHWVVKLLKYRLSLMSHFTAVIYLTSSSDVHEHTEVLDSSMHLIMKRPNQTIGSAVHSPVS